MLGGTEAFSLLFGGSCNDKTFEAARCLGRNKYHSLSEMLYWTGSLWPSSLRSRRLTKLRTLTVEDETTQRRAVDHNDIAALEKLAAANPTNTHIPYNVGRIHALQKSYEKGIG